MVPINSGNDCSHSHDGNHYHCCCLLRVTPFVPPPLYCSSCGVDSSDSVETKDPVFSASRSLVARRAQQPKVLMTLVSRLFDSLRTSTFLRKNRTFTREIARIGISTHVSGTPNAQATAEHETGHPSPYSPRSCRHKLLKAVEDSASPDSAKGGEVQSGCRCQKHHIFTITSEHR